MITIYKYLAANKVLLRKNVILDINVVTKPPITLEIYFLSRIVQQHISIVLVNIRNILIVDISTLNKDIFEANFNCYVKSKPIKTIKTIEDRRNIFMSVHVKFFYL